MLYFIRYCLKPLFGKMHLNCEKHMDEDVSLARATLARCQAQIPDSIRTEAVLDPSYKGKALNCVEGFFALTK